MFSNLTEFDFLEMKMSKVLLKQPHKDMFEKYKNEKRFDKMFQYLWELDEAHSILKVELKHYSKNEVLSEELRKQGNKLYEQKRFEQALDKYNMSIIESPYPDITKEHSAGIAKEDKNHDESKYKALALGYANRSAVLYELKQYRKSIDDIDYAIQFGYPKILHCKLAERKAKCLIALKNFQEAKTLLQTTIASLSGLSVADSRKSLENLEASCSTELTDDEEPSSHETNEDPLLQNLSSLTNDELLFAYRNPSPPILKDVNPTIPAFSSALRLTYSANSGRSIVAARDIKPGELIGVEAPYVKMLTFGDPTIMRKFCCVCVARCLTPLPCTYCNKVIYCSDSCRNEGFTKFHKLECSVLPSLIQLDMGLSVPYNIYRILAKIPFIKLKSLIPKLVEERNKPRHLQGFNDQGVYESSDYTTVFHLEGNFDARNLNDIIEKCCKAFILTKLLIKSTRYFIDELGEPFEPSISDIILVGSTVFMHFGNIQANGKELIEYQVPVNMNIGELAPKNIGGGVYSTISLFNHSCNLSAIQVEYGYHKATYSLSFIPEGSEVCISYGEKFYIENLAIRRAELLRNYKFKCNCEACTNNWPTLSDLKTLPKLKKNAKIILGGATDKMAQLNLSKSKEIESYMKDLQNRFSNCYLGVTKYNLYGGVEISIEVLEFIGRYTVMPCSLYVDAQQLLEFFGLQKQGTCNFIR